MVPLGMDNASISSRTVEVGFGQLKLLPIIVIVTISTAVFIFKPLLSNRALEEFYESQPCPSRKQQWFSWLRATLRSFTDTSDRVAEGYAKYSKSNIPFLVPNVRKGPILALPPSQLKAVFGNPEQKLAAHAPQFENVSAQYTMRDPAIYPSNYEVDVVQKQITRKYGTVTHELAEELSLAFDEYWGTAEEWHDVLAWESLQKIAARAVNRVAVGLPLCRDKNFLERTRRYAMSIPRDGFLIGLIPSFLKPLLGPLITWPGRNDCNAGIQACIPLVQDRLQKYQKKKAEPDCDWLPPNDVLQWMIEESNASGNPEQMKSKRIAHRLVMYNFNSVPPIGLTLAHLLLNLYSGPNAEKYVARLRKESREVLASSPDRTWTKDTVSKLVLADSTIRESMRMSGFGSLALPRRVSAPDGIELPGGIKVPKGVQIEIPMHSIHMDDVFYPDAAQFKPFRFAYGSGPRKDGTRQQRSAVTIDDTFLGFGFGRNGCPGRFFGTHIMKVMLAYIVQKYDMEFMSKRQPMWTLMELRILPESTTLKIRRKKQAE